MGEIDVDDKQLMVVANKIKSNCSNFIMQMESNLKSIKVPDVDEQFGRLDLSDLNSKMPQLQNKINQISDIIVTLANRLSSIEDTNGAIADSLGISMFAAGDTIELDSGIKYFESSLGFGKSGTIGGEIRPDGKNYIVDRLAIYADGKLVENMKLSERKGEDIDKIIQDYAKSNKIDSNKIEVSAHVLYVDKNGNKQATGWLADNKITGTQMTEKKYNLGEIEKGIQADINSIKEKYEKQMNNDKKTTKVTNPGNEEKNNNDKINSNSPDRKSDVEDVSKKSEKQEVIQNKDDNNQSNKDIIGINFKDKDNNDILGRLGISDSDVKMISTDEHGKVRMVELKNGVRIDDSGGYGFIYQNKDKSGNVNRTSGVNCTAEIDLLENALSNGKGKLSSSDWGDFNLSKISSVGDVDDKSFEGKRITFEGNAKFEKVNVENCDIKMVRGIGSEGQCEFGYIYDENNNKLMTGVVNNANCQNDGVYAVSADGKIVVPHFSQVYGPWAGDRVIALGTGSGLYSSVGCGITSDVDILNMLGYNVTPKTAFSAPVDSVDGRQLKGALAEYGLETSKDFYSQQELLNELNNNHPVILYMPGGAKYGVTNKTITGEQHIIALLGINEKGEILVADPGANGNNTYTSIDKLPLQNAFSVITPKATDKKASGNDSNNNVVINDTSDDEIIPEDKASTTEKKWNDNSTKEMSNLNFKDRNGKNILNQLGISDSDVAMVSRDEHGTIRMVELKNGLRIDDNNSYGFVYKEKGDSGKVNRVGGINCTGEINLLNNAVDLKKDSDTDLSDFSLTNISDFRDIDDEYFDGRRISFSNEARLDMLNVNGNDTTIIRGIDSEGYSKIGFYIDNETKELTTRT